MARFLLMKFEPSPEPRAFIGERKEAATPYGDPQRDEHQLPSRKAAAVPRQSDENHNHP